MNAMVAVDLLSFARPCRGFGELRPSHELREASATRFPCSQDG